MTYPTIPSIRRNTPYLILIAILSSQPATAQQGEQTIAVTGHATLKVEPDVVGFTIMISARDSTIEGAKVGHDRRARAVIHLLDELGVPEENVKTDHMHLQEDWMYRSESSVYRAEQSMGIVLTDVEGWEGLLARLIDVGATGLQGVSFWTTELDSLRLVISEMALRDAVRKAESMAAALGKQLGEIVTVTDGEELDSRFIFPQERISVTASAYTVPSHLQEMAPISRPGFIELKSRTRIVFRLIGG
jgi:hypothetical protein